MKKKIFIIILAIFSGAILSFVTLYNYQKKEKVDIDETLTILQTGIYKDYQNALKEQSKVDGSIILKESDYYVVIAGASTSSAGLTKLESMLNNQGIHYYKKEKTLNITSDLKKYNMLLDKTVDQKSISLLNQKILESINNEYLN